VCLKETAVHCTAVLLLLKNYNTCKPDPVPGRDQAAIIYLGCCSHNTSCCQPADIRRAAVRRQLIWHFSTQGLPLSIVANTYRSLLHYIFTLTPINRGGNFLWHCLSAGCPAAYPLGSALLFAVRTFLLYY
jgi:hypothetical protein